MSSTHGHIVAAHDQMLTLHLRMHVEAHEPRADDPHYHLFKAAKQRLKRQGLWACVVADDLCAGELELHHSVIEFSEANAVDPDRVARALGLHFDDDEAFQTWIERPGNLEVLCANHHRTRYGIHVLPEPLWNAVRYHRRGLQAPAQFVPAHNLGTSPAE